MKQSTNAQHMATTAVASRVVAMPAVGFKPWGACGSQGGLGLTQALATATIKRPARHLEMQLT